MNPCRSLKFHYWLYWDLLWKLQTTKLKRVVSKILKVIQHRTKGIPSQEIIIPPWEEGAYTSVGPNPLTMCLIWTKLESIDIISSTNSQLWHLFAQFFPFMFLNYLNCRKARGPSTIETVLKDGLSPQNIASDQSPIEDSHKEELKNYVKGLFWLWIRGDSLSPC